MNTVYKFSLANEIHVKIFFVNILIAQNCIIPSFSFKKSLRSVPQDPLLRWKGAEASFRGAGGAVAPPPPPPQGKRKKRKKERKKRKKKKREKKRKRKKRTTMNDVKLLHIKCCFFQFFNSPVAWKNKKNFGPPKKKLKWRPWKGALCFYHIILHLGPNS